MVSLGIFSAVPSTELRAVRSAQPLKVSTRDFSWVKGGRCVWLTTYNPCSTETSRKSRALIYPEPFGPPRPVAGDLYLYFTLLDKQERRRTFTVTVGRLRVSTVAVENVIYSECLSVALGTQHAMRMGRIIMCGLSGCTTFFEITYKGTILEKKSHST